LITVHNAAVSGLIEESWTRLSNVPVLLPHRNHFQDLNSGIVNLIISHLTRNMVTDTTTTTIQSMDMETLTRKNLS